jgi:hypothetical protein
MRSHARPLSDHSQLEIVRTQLSERIEDAAIEYKVHNFSRRKDGTIQRADGLSWIDVVWLAGLVIAWKRLDMASLARFGFFEKTLTVCAYCPLYEVRAEGTDTTCSLAHIRPSTPTQEDQNGALW